MQRDIPGLLWRSFRSRRLTLVLVTAIALVVSLGALIPQMPDGIVIGSREYGRWYAEIQGRYLQWTDLLGDLGFFSLDESLWLRLPVALLIINLAVCAVEQFEAVLRRPSCTSEEFERAFRRASQTGTFILADRPGPAVAILRELLTRHRYRVEVQEGDEGSHLTANRFSWTRWTTLVIHGGLILAIVGLALGGRLAWREDKIRLSPGQEYQVQHGSSLSLRLDDFQAELYPDGTPRSYQARLTLLEDGSELMTGMVSPNAPLRYGGISFYQLSHGPLVTIRGLDPEGHHVSLRALAPATTLQTEETLQLSDDENEGYIAVPEPNLVLRIVLQSQPLSGGRHRPALLVQAYRGGMTDLVFSKTLFGSSSLQIEDNSYAFEWRHYAVLTVTSDPSVGPIFLGAASLLAAATTIIHLPPRRIWAAVTSTEGVVKIRLVRLGEEDKGVGAREFDALIGEMDEAYHGQ